MNKLQRGFTLVESLLIISIVAVIGLGGYYVWHSHKTTVITNGSSSQAIPKSKTSTNPDTTANWFSYEDPKGFYSVRVADGWNLVRPSNSSSYLLGWSPTNITYQTGKLATVSNEEGGRDGPVSFVLYVVGQEGTSPFLPTDAEVKQTGFATAQGLMVSKYLLTQTTEPEGIGLPKGGRGYTYVVSKGSTTIVVTHDESPGDPDNVSMVEQVVKTIEL